jgi:hypothetical protein
MIPDSPSDIAEELEIVGYRQWRMRNISKLIVERRVGHIMNQILDSQLGCTLARSQVLTLSQAILFSRHGTRRSSHPTHQGVF